MPAPFKLQPNQYTQDERLKLIYDWTAMKMNCYPKMNHISFKSFLDHRWAQKNGLETRKKEYKGRCSYCNRIVGKTLAFSYDHVIPQSKGGPDEKYNKVPCCIECNHWKGNKELERWHEEVVLLLTLRKTRQVILPGRLFSTLALTIIGNNIPKVLKSVKKREARYKPKQYT